MNKLLRKRSVFYSLVAAVVLVGALLIYLLVRPVATGFTYRGEYWISNDSSAEYKFKVLNSKQIEVTASEKGSDDEPTVETYYYVENDGEIIVFYLLDDENYDETKEKYLEDWDVYYGLYASSINPVTLVGFPTEINAYSMGTLKTANGYSYTCVGTILVTIFGGALELALIAFTGMSASKTFKKKRK